MTHDRPQHTKLLSAIRRVDASQTVGDFLFDHGYAICELRCLRCGVDRSHLDQPVALDDGTSCDHPDHRVQYVRVRGSLNDLLARMFDIDPDALEDEKRAMLDEIRLPRAVEDVNTEVV